MTHMLRRFTFAFVLLFVGLFTIGLSPAWGLTLTVPGGSVNGTLTATHVKDTYTYTVPADGDVTFTVITDANLYALVQYYDKDDTTQLAYSYVGYSSSASNIIPHLGPGATYHITVTAYQGSGNYTVSDTEAYPVYAKSNTPNSTPAKGTKLTVGQTATGVIGYSTTSYNTTDAVDYFKYTIPVDGDVTVNLTTDSTLYALIQFWDTDSTTQINYTYVSYGTSGSFTVPHLGPGGAYYISVIVYGGYGSYQLTSSEVQPPYAKSNTGNSTAKTAEVMTIGTPAKPVMKAGVIGYSTKSYNTTDNVDYYKVTPNTDGDMTVNLTTDSTLYALIQFWDTDSTTQINYTYVSYGTSGSFTVPHLGPGGTYYISVIVYSGYGSYQVSDSVLKPKETTQKEPDGTFLTAHPLVLNKKTTGLLGYSNTSYNSTYGADYFSVPGNPGTLTVTVATEPTLYALIQIWDGNGNQLAYFYTDFGSSGQTNVVLQSGGSYYVSVSVYSGYGGYTLTNTFH